MIFDQKEKNMIARITTVLNCTEEELWNKIIEPKSLQFVASPLVCFRPLVNGELDGKWVTDKTYELKLFFLKVVPFGQHRIKIVKIDRESNTIISNESGTLSPVWNHTITFHQIEHNKLRYTDEIEFESGWLTPAIWVFAHLFYRYRQKRWRSLCSKNHSSQG